jgi:hypothetical protein
MVWDVPLAFFNAFKSAVNARIFVRFGSKRTRRNSKKIIGK